MNVDFNNLRLNIQTNFNVIVGMLSECCDLDEINMDCTQVEELQSELNDLRDHIATLMCIYTDDSNNIADQANLAEVFFV